MAEDVGGNPIMVTLFFRKEKIMSSDFQERVRERLN
jgi:hypothetical protein